jgi:spore coat polysaccharide biosynthesis protein SpsF
MSCISFAEMQDFISMKHKKINIIIQARMGSTRLPGKILKPIMGRPMLSYLLERLRDIQKPHALIIATSLNSQDDVIESFAQKEKVLVFRGDEEDVLDRYYQASLAYPADYIIRITSDCPLIDPHIVEQAIHLMETEKPTPDYVSNVLLRTFPRGMDVELFSFAALKKAAKEAITPSEREHVTPFFHKHPSRFRLANFTHSLDLSNYRLTVDTPEDFLLISKIFEDLYPKKKKFTLDDIIQEWGRHPDWSLINAHVKQKEV